MLGLGLYPGVWVMVANLEKIFLFNLFFLLGWRVSSKKNSLATALLVAQKHHLLCYSRLHTISNLSCPDQNTTKTAT